MTVIEVNRSGGLLYWGRIESEDMAATKSPISLYPLTRSDGVPGPSRGRLCRLVAQSGSGFGPILHGCAHPGTAVATYTVRAAYQRMRTSAPRD